MPDRTSGSNASANFASVGRRGKIASRDLFRQSGRQRYGRTVRAFCTADFNFKEKKKWQEQKTLGSRQDVSPRSRRLFSADFSGAAQKTSTI